jgi:hypothetical protein
MKRASEVEALVEKWKSRLGLSDWLINVYIRDKYYPGEPEIEACIEGDVKYKEANLEVWKEFWKFDAKHKEINVIHELCHLLLWRLHPHMAPSGDDALEEVTQTLATRFYATQV